MKDVARPAAFLSEEEVRAKCLELRNWGRWGEDDEVGTLNYVTGEDVVRAAGLVRRGRSFSLALPFDGRGPQFGRKGRFNPIHYMIQSGVDAYAGLQDADGLRYADDAVIMPLQGGTQWDALSHVFYDEQMYNGYDIRLVNSNGAARCGIQQIRDRVCGRGVLLDVARWHGVEVLPDGYGITAEELEMTAVEQGVELGRGDFLLVRTGQLQARLAAGDWGFYAGGPAPGLAFDTLDLVHGRQLAAVATDTFGVEVRPEATEHIRRPWHWVAIPNMGLTVGEIFFLEELAADCAADGRWEFLFVAQPLPFTGAVGSPINPIAIK